MSSSWGAPQRGTPGALQARARSKLLLSDAGTIRQLLRDVSDAEGCMPAEDVVVCLGSLGMDALRPPLAGIVAAHTARGLVRCDPLLDEIVRTGAAAPQQATVRSVAPAPALAPATAAAVNSRALPDQRTSSGYTYSGRQTRGGFSKSPLQRLRQKWKAAAYSGGKRDIPQLFRYYDKDNSGEMDFDEFRKAARKDAKLTKNEVPDVQLQKLFNRVDTDGGGTIGLDEFVELLEGTEDYPTYGARVVETVLPPAPVEAGQTTRVQPQRAPLRVLVRLQNFPTERALQGLLRFDPDETGEVPVEAFVSVLKSVGVATDQISVLLKERPKTRLGGRASTVHYRGFLQHLTGPLEEGQVQPSLQTMLPRPASVLSSWVSTTASDRGTDTESERYSVAAAAPPAEPVNASSEHFAAMMHGLSEDESKLSLELWKRCAELEQEVKLSRQQLSEGGEEMVSESRQLMKQLREYQQQCKRETGESLTMVVESRRMLSIVSKEKEQVTAERDSLGQELAELKLQLAKATDGAGMTSAKANQSELDMVQMRGELATVRSEASYMKTRVREIDEELAASSYHLATVQEENTTLVRECERLQAANRAASVEGLPPQHSRARSPPLDSARRAWEAEAAGRPPRDDDDRGRGNHHRQRRRRDEERPRR